MTLEDASYVAAVVGAIVALFGFPLLGWQLFPARLSRGGAGDAGARGGAGGEPLGGDRQPALFTSSITVFTEPVQRPN
jgi:hypothetical protein